MLLLLIPAYLIAVHYSVTQANPYPGAVAVLVVLLWGIGPALRRGSTLAWGCLTALVGLVAVTRRLELLPYLSPVAINLLLLFVFGRTLQAGQRPLITRIAAMCGDQMSPRVLAYTRGVTVAWTAFFAVMALESLLLAVFAPPPVWSLFTNGLNYGFVILFFAIEYAVRLRCLPPPEGGLRGSLRRMRQLDVRDVLNDRGAA